MRDRTFPRHVHIWREWQQVGEYDHTTFVFCERCAKNGRANMLYLSRKATLEFRRQIKAGIKPRFVGNSLIKRVG